MTIDLEPQPDKINPRVFIGSSSGQLELAKKIQDLLGDDIDAVVWNQNVSDQLGRNLLDELLLKVSHHDFAVMVLSSDDFTTSKGKRKESPRDNVIFELGMFMGARGRTRVFPVVIRSESTDLKVPSDLEGNLELRLDPEKLESDPDHLAQQVGELKKSIDDRADEAAVSLLPSAALAYGYVNNFLRPVSEHLQNGETRNPDETIKYDRRKYQFNVYMPKEKLANASVEVRDALVDDLGLLPFVVGPKPSPPRPDRTYSFFVKPEPENGLVQFVDIPTTIRTSQDIINLTLSGGPLGARKDIRTMMEKQEINNFAKAIRYIVENEGLSIQRKIKYWWMSDTQHDE